MAKISRIEIKRAGIRAMLKHPGVLADVAARASRIASAAGPGMETSSMVGVNRARASVITATAAARKAEAEHMALSRALDAGR